jgi:fibro-slime domain-containing protein
VKRVTRFVFTSILLGSIGSAATVNLAGTIRDFKGANEPGGHPDFEALIGGLLTGAVGNYLAGGLPVFTGTGIPSFSNAANFDEWYTDVPGVNLSQSLSLALSDAGHPGLFSYANANFFPIDNQLYGNTPGELHNFHFTYDIHSLFSYHEGETLSFTGDDDVWVFINNKLAVDLGGIHNSATGSITLDASNAASYGLTSGNTYSLDLFFAERHTTESHFSMETTLDLLTPAPEPSALLLFGSALFVLALRRKRRAI